MDIYCPRCAEPWDNDEMHYTAEEFETTYEKVKAAFRSVGCAVFEGEFENPVCEAVRDDRTALIGAAMDLSDHADDWAADLDGWL